MRTDLRAVEASDDAVAADVVVPVGKATPPRSNRQCRLQVLRIHSGTYRAPITKVVTLVMISLQTSRDSQSQNHVTSRDNSNWNCTVDSLLKSASNGSTSGAGAALCRVLPDGAACCG